MGLAPEMQLVVKRTFLEFVEKGCAEEPRFRAFTDTVLFRDYDSTASASQSEADIDEQAPALPTSNLSTPRLEPAAKPAWADQAHALCSAEAFPWMPHSADAAMQVCMAWIPPGTGHQAAFPGLPMSFHAPQPAVSMVHSTTASTAALRASDHDSPHNTTLMLRGLPEACTRDVLLGLLNHLGFAGHYDLVYVPVNFATGVGLGYAFVNAVSSASARRLWACFDGFRAWPTAGEEPCTVCWSDPHQGVTAHVERYRNSPVMHDSVPEAWKPALFECGLRVPFPAPTKAIKAPKAPRNRH